MPDHETNTQTIDPAVKLALDAAKAGDHHNPFSHTCERGEVRDEFAGVVLTPAGVDACRYIGLAFTECLTRVEAVMPAGRERALVLTKLQEACSWAKRGVSWQPGNRDGDDKR